MKFDKRSFVVGMLATLLLVGCMVAMSNADNANTGWRYELRTGSDLTTETVTLDQFGIFDRETGTYNLFHGDTVLVYHFSAS